MTLRPSGPHRGQEPSPSDGEPTRHAYADPSGAHSARPLLRVVKGEPTAEELAVLTAVVAALSQRRERRKIQPVGAWASYADAHRQPVQPGPGAWRAAGRFA
ncbi:MAG: acyl-CoA carboxylase subunit epsilon [Blastococcus sp.]